MRRTLLRHRILLASFDLPLSLSVCWPPAAASMNGVLHEGDPIPHNLIVAAIH
jgi:hypothetical protein